MASLAILLSDFLEKSEFVVKNAGDFRERRVLVDKKWEMVGVCLRYCLHGGVLHGVIMVT